nr:extracellular solute-binding protein [uncultured Oscillibacter sp.]
MKKFLAIALSLCAALSLLAGCGGGQQAAAPSGGNAAGGDTGAAGGDSPYAGHTLYVANWQGYCFDMNYCKKAFEDKFDCKVEMVYFDSYDDLMTNLQTGGNATIDVCNLSQNYTQYFHDQDLIMTVDRAKVPNYEGLADAYKDLAPYAVDEDGNVFAYPWCFGVTSLCYNPEKTGGPVTSWSDLYKPEYAGHVCLFGDYGDGMIIGSLLSGQDPAYPDDVDVSKVAAKLSELKPQILSFWSSYDDILIPWKAGEFWVGNMWSGAYVQLLKEGYPIEVVHPAEGTVGYIDCCCVVKGTDEFDLACEWLNWMESYELQYTMATSEGTDYPPNEGEVYMTYPPVNEKVLNNLTEDQRTALYLNPMPTKICMLNYLTADQKDAWVDCWENFKASR